jgi:hypothetical protein
MRRRFFLSTPRVNAFGDYFILVNAGDSNYDGRGPAVDRPVVPSNTLYLWDGSGVTEVTTQSIANDGDFGGFYQQFAIEIKAYFGVPVLIVQEGHGGSYITSQPGSSPANNDWSATGIRYTPMKTAAQAACAFAGKALPDLITFGDGINDIRTGPGASTIGAAFDNLMARFAADFPGVPVLTSTVGFDGTNSLTQKLYDFRMWVINSCYPVSENHNVVSIGIQLGNLMNVDLLHYNQTALNYRGQQFARWVIESSYSKMARCIIASQFDNNLNTNRKNLLASIVDGLVSRGDFLELECLQLYFTTVEQNLRFDISQLSWGGNIDATYVANSYLRFDGVDDDFIPGVIASLTTRSTQNDIIEGVFVVTNRDAGGTQGTLFGVSGGSFNTAVFQLSATEAYECNDGTLTVSGGAVPLNSNMFHGAARNAGTKIKYENKTQAHTASVASGGRSNVARRIGAAGTSGGGTGYMDVDIAWYIYSKFTTLDLSSLFDDIENARLNWNN